MRGRRLNFAIWIMAFFFVFCIRPGRTQAMDGGRAFAPPQERPPLAGSIDAIEVSAAQQPLYLPGREADAGHAHAFVLRLAATQPTLPDTFIRKPSRTWERTASPLRPPKKTSPLAYSMGAHGPPEPYS